MAKEAEFPRVEVAVTLVVRDAEILAVYNPEWRSYTLPMTKCRRWQDPKLPKAVRDEDEGEAAARAAAEWFAGTVAKPQFLFKASEYSQSDRDGLWKSYHFHVFKLALHRGEEPKQGARYEWLSADQFEQRSPISPTARFLIKELIGWMKLKGQDSL